MVGESGGGKSTTAKLIARFYDPDTRCGPGRRHRPPRRAAAQLPAPARRRAAGSVPVQRHDRRQHPLRQARGDRRRGARRPRRRSASTVSPRGSRPGSTTSCARAARALGRRAPADLDRTRAARRSAHPHPRRGDVEHRPAERDPDRARVRPAAQAAGRRSSSRTAWRPFGAPTRSSSSSTGRIVQRGTEAELLAQAGPFRRLAETLAGTTMGRVA